MPTHPGLRSIPSPRHWLNTQSVQEPLLGTWREEESDTTSPVQVPDCAGETAVDISNVKNLSGCLCSLNSSANIQNACVCVCVCV